MRKHETDYVKWTKNHGFWEQKMGWYRRFIWQPSRAEVLMLNGTTVERDFFLT
jgi:hypothetical protein